jgi:hypothetical protein
VKELRNAGPEPKRFTVADGQLANIATAAIGALVRLGSGGFAPGYSVSLQPDDGKYAVVRVMGRKLAETSEESSLPRPAKPLELYEFEGGARELRASEP